jgi:hypothetical protein
MLLIRSSCDALAAFFGAAQGMPLAGVLRWFWSMNVNGPMTRSGHMPTLEEAKAQFQKSWKTWSELVEVEYCDFTAGKRDRHELEGSSPLVGPRCSRF